MVWRFFRFDTCFDILSQEEQDQFLAGRRPRIALSGACAGPRQNRLFSERLLLWYKGPFRVFLGRYVSRGIGYALSGSDIFIARSVGYIRDIANRAEYAAAFFWRDIFELLSFVFKPTFRHGIFERGQSKNSPGVYYFAGDRHSGNFGVFGLIHI